MASISDAAIQFMADLQQNNSKEWFDEHRDRYETELREPMKRLKEDLSGPVSLLIPGSNPPKISRINNDIRFHKDKPTYKAHMWIKWKNPPAELMTAVGREGWTAVAAAKGPKKDDLVYWRRNLIEHVDRWRAWAEAVKLGKQVKANTRDLYKTSLYEDTPDDVAPLVQARGVWLVARMHERFSNSPEGDFLNELARLLPAYLFMTCPPAQLPDRLDELGNGILPPDDDIMAVWNSVRDGAK